jgi:hypothetical protein
MTGLLPVRGDGDTLVFALVLLAAAGFAVCEAGDAVGWTRAGLARALLGRAALVGALLAGVILIGFEVVAAAAAGFAACEIGRALRTSAPAAPAHVNNASATIAVRTTGPMTGKTPARMSGSMPSSMHRVPASRLALINRGRIPGEA